MIFVISGPSGSGKTTLAKKLLSDAGLKKSLSRLASFTTRPRRPGERQGHDYFFVSKEQFLEQRRAKKFLEWIEYLGYYYATAKKIIEAKLNQGRSIVLCLDQRGAFRIRRLYPELARLIFILPPDLKTLKKRIDSRANGAKAKAAKENKQRLSLAKREIRHKHMYDFCLVNKDLSKALRELKSIVKKEIK